MTMEGISKAEKLAREFEQCVFQRMKESPGLSREQAEALCLPATKPSDEPTYPRENVAGIGASKLLGIHVGVGNITERQTQKWEREYQESVNEPTGENPGSEIRDYWSRAKRRQRIREQIQDTTHPEELQPHERCVRALMEIKGFSKEKANLECTLIEEKRKAINKENLGQGDLTDDDLEAGCISSVMTTQHVTMEVARSVCDRILHPESFIEHKGLVVLPSILTQADFVAAVERRMAILTHETVKEASLELLTLFGTDSDFAFYWRNQCRRDRAIDACITVDSKESCEKKLLFVDFLDDALTHRLERDIWHYIGEQIYIRTRLFGISENRAKEWVHSELRRKGLLTDRTPLPEVRPIPIGDLHLKSSRQIRRMSQETKKTGLDNLYLEPAYGMNESEKEEFDLENCIEGHMDDGLSREEATTKCEERRKRGRGLPGDDPND